MEIFRNTTVVARPYLSGGSYTFEEINGQRIACLEFVLLRPVEFALNDSILFQGEKYYLRHREDVTKQETSRGFKYSIKFYHDMYRLHDVACFPFKEPDFRKGVNKYNGNARQILEIVVRSMNRVHPGWSIADCDETPVATFDLQDKTCAEVVNELISRYNSELRVDGSRRITFGKRHTAGSGRTFFQGEGGGFREIRLSAIDETPPLTRLYTYGSDRNMAAQGTKDALQYLPLPGGAKYIEKNVDKYGIIEETHRFDEIYPKGVFAVTAKIDDFTLQASSIDFDLAAQLIDGTEPVITFQDGGLAGYDLNIVKGSWDNSKKQFKLAKVEEENALKVPGDIHFAVGDKFIITGIRMPQSYIDKASEELKQAAQKYLDERCEIRTKLNVVCDEIYFKQNGISVRCGEMMKVKDTRLNIDKQIRVTAVKTFIENDYLTPYRYEITLSDFVEAGKFAQTIRQIADESKKANAAAEEAMKYSRRRWQDVKDAQALLMEDFKKLFGEKINPVSIETMQLIVGHEQLQFMFVDSKTEPQKSVPIYPEYKNGRIQIRANGAYLKHMTMGVKGISSKHAPSEYRYWQMADFTSNELASNKVYRLYAKVEESGQNGSFVLYDTFKQMRDEAGYLLLFMGYSHAEAEGDRAFSPVYGFTEILPGQITTSRIQDPAARFVLDLENGRATGPMTITAGSIGYENLTDKPNLSTYMTKSEFQIESDRIRAEVGVIRQTGSETKKELEKKLAEFQAKNIQDINALIAKQQATDGEIYRFKTAGYMTQDGANAWWAAGINERGQEIASYITQTPSTLSLLAQNLNLEGNAVFRAYRQKTDNTSSTLETTKDKVSNLNHELNRTNSEVNDLRTAAQKAQAAVSSLPSWVKKSKIKEALESETIIQGGFINTTLINTSAINLSLKSGSSIGGFYLDGENITGKGYSWVNGPGTFPTTGAVSISPRDGIKIVKYAGGAIKTEILHGGVTVSHESAQTTISPSGLYINQSAGNSTEIFRAYKNNSTRGSIIMDIKNPPGEWSPRSYVALHDLLHVNTVKKEWGAHTFKKVFIDINSGLLCWDD